jgi:hypothetical protein
MNNISQETIIACDLTAIDPAERDQHILTTEQLFAAVQHTDELPDGYAFRLSAEHLLDAAHFIGRERLCCPFFTFTLQQEANGGPLWLKLTGSAEVKQFIQAEFGAVLRPEVGHHE